MREYLLIYQAIMKFEVEIKWFWFLKNKMIFKKIQNVLVRAPNLRNDLKIKLETY